jgi:hypothetical protein
MLVTAAPAPTPTGSIPLPHKSRRIKNARNEKATDLSSIKPIRGFTLSSLSFDWLPIDASLLRGRYAQRLVNPDEIVPDRVQSDHMAVVLKLL